MVDGVHVDAEELDVLARLGGLGNVLPRVVGALRHLALHVDQAYFT